MNPRVAILLCGLTVLARPPLQAQDKLADYPYYPLAQGNQWTYKSGEKMVTLRVAGPKKIDDALCVVLEAKGEGRVASECITLGPDGLYRVEAMGKLRLTPHLLFLKTKAKPGDSWEFSCLLGFTTKIEGTSTQTLEDVTVPAGTYKNAVKVHTRLKRDGKAIESTCWYARGVGMVKQEQDLGGPKILLELERFDAAK